MGIKANGISSFDRAVDSWKVSVEDAVLYSLGVLGEKCVKEARSNHEGTGKTRRKEYTNRSGNLTSSMGYVIAKDGVVIRQQGFETVLEGSEGSAAGPVFAAGIAERYRNGYALIVVAGMNYAAYVADKGYNVLDSAELLAEREAKKMLKDLGIER